VHIVTHRLNLNGLFVAHLGKEAWAKQQFEFSKPAGPAKQQLVPPINKPTARLSLFLSQWQNITKDPVIIAIVRG
jgi:hypothetical protein